jgi:MinD superfamily P-loop ATPase
MPVPVISSLLDSCLVENREGTTVIDCSPGTSCPMVAAVSACDYVILVTEPTPFGLHDLRAASDVVVGQLDLPAGVLINKSGPEDRIVEDFCRERDLPIIGRIPLDRRIAENLSEGIPLVEAIPGYGDLFRDLLEISGRSVKD